MILSFRTERETMGVYYMGNETLLRDGTEVPDYEVLKLILPPMSHKAQNCKFDHSFVIRSADFSFRMKVFVQANKEDVDRPYRITFKNLAFEGDPVELKHSSSGFIWINQGEQVTHITDHMHPFTFRRRGEVDVVTIEIWPYEDRPD